MKRVWFQTGRKGNFWAGRPMEGERGWDSCSQFPVHLVENAVQEWGLERIHSLCSQQERIETLSSSQEFFFFFPDMLLSKVVIKFLAWELAFLGQMKQGKETRKQILNRAASQISSGFRLLFGLPSEGGVCACVPGLTPIFPPSILISVPSLLLLVPEWQIEKFGVGLLLLRVPLQMDLEWCLIIQSSFGAHAEAGQWVCCKGHEAELLGGVLAPKPSPQCRQCCACKVLQICISLHQAAHPKNVLLHYVRSCHNMR